MAQITIDSVSKAKLDKFRAETGAGTYGEVIRNALKAYGKELAYEKREAAETDS